jgi:hypothetical protein
MPDILEIIRHHGDAGDEGNPETEAAGEDDDPRPIPLDSGESLPDGQRFLFFLNGFLEVTARRSGKE